MKKKDLIAKIQENIEKLHILTKNYNSEGKIAQINIDLALSKTVELYDNMLMLDIKNCEPSSSTTSQHITQNNNNHIVSKPVSQPVIQPVSQPVPQPTPQPVPQPEHIVESKPANNNGYNPQSFNEPSEPENIVHNQHHFEPVIEPEPTPEPQSYSAKPAYSTTPQYETKVVTKPVVTENNGFANGNGSSNGNGYNNSNSKINTAFNNKSNINSMVGTNQRIKFSLNDKFLFIKSLFNQNSKSFEDAVDTLSSCGSYDQAEHFIDNVLGFDPDNRMVKYFKSIIEKKFI